jgi:hypothetical protein
MIGSSAWCTTRVGTRIAGSTARTSISATSGIISSTVAGLAARRSCRAHVDRISSFHGISGLSTCSSAPVPQTRSMSSKNFSVETPSARSPDRCAKPSSTTSAVVRDGCVAANNALVANALKVATRTASLLPRSSNTAVMLSAHCSKVGSAPDLTGSDAPAPDGRRRSVDRATSSPRPSLEWKVAREIRHNL